MLIKPTVGCCLVSRLGEGLAVGPGREVRQTLDAILNGTVAVPAAARADALSVAQLSTPS
ncbi:hypothetical protein OHT68_16975 [Streptomyces canus]|uniref:hypothetical protein n=1 Tax=Streptomyces canus TaxID=58343 RepID=UPI002E2B1714|nr:hypothetical protein [Streptomyces canus]